MADQDEHLHRSRAFDAPTAEADSSRDDALRAELRGVQQVNGVIEGVLSSLGKAKDNMEVRLFGLPPVTHVADHTRSADRVFHRRECEQSLEPLDQDLESNRPHPAAAAVQALGRREQGTGEYPGRDAGEATGGAAARGGGEGEGCCQGERCCRYRGETVSCREEANGEGRDEEGCYRDKFGTRCCGGLEDGYRFIHVE